MDGKVPEQEPAGEAKPNGRASALSVPTPTRPSGSRGRAIDGLPELLAQASGLETEMQTIADTALRVLACRSVAIYALADDEPRGQTRLAPLATAGTVDRFRGPGVGLAHLAVSHWLSHSTDVCGWISGQGVTILPILYQRECVGAVAVQHGEQGMPADARLRDLGNLIGLAALAIANHRLRAEGRRRIAELRGLQEIGRITGIGVSAESMLDGIFEASTSILSYDTASLFVVDEANGVLRLSASRNIPPEVARRSQFRIGEGIVGWVIAQDRPAIVPDTLRDARFRLAGVRRRRPHSLLVVPLRMHGQVIAALSFARHSPNAFTDHDLSLAEVIAGYAAHAMEHAHLAKTVAEVQSLRQGAELLATISHDVRAPLSLIRVVVDLLREHMPNMDAQQLELLDTMARASDQLGKMINAVLETSRLEASLLRLEPEPVCLAELAQEVVTALSWRAGSEHRLLVNVPPALLVYADPTQLHRVVSNLVDNAIKYSPGGGDVVVQAREGDGGVLVSVADQGVGIAREHLSQVFERFYRAPQTSTASESFGLGLYICKRIVEAHGGRIWVESCPNCGSTFTFWLPSEVPFRSPAPPTRGGGDDSQVG